LRCTPTSFGREASGLAADPLAGGLRVDGADASRGLRPGGAVTLGVGERHLLLSQVEAAQHRVEPLVIEHATRGVGEVVDVGGDEVVQRQPVEVGVQGQHPPRSAPTPVRAAGVLTVSVLSAAVERTENSVEWVADGAIQPG
jgi:hypothetical protein